MRRGDRGYSIRELRLVGQNADQVFPVQREDSGGTVEPAAAADWIRSQLAGVRSAESLTFLCLDVEGGTCAWIGAPSADPQVVAAVARFGSSAHGESASDTGRASAAMNFFAPSPMDSTLQPLAQNGHHTLRLPFARRGASDEPVIAKRLPVLAITDVSARLLVDQLDRRNIPVETVASLWHAACLAWDPGWTAGGPAAENPDPLVAAPAAGIGATILIDPLGRLIWSWSRGTELLVAGSMRLRTAQHAAAVPGEATPADSRTRVVFGRDEVARLTNEWLSWSAQTSLAPTRITCVMPEGSEESASEFGQALGRSWPGATIDAALHEDPIGATLRRIASRLEQTPESAAGPSPHESLVNLSCRRGTDHRRLYVWTAMTILAGSVMAGVAAWKLNQAAAATRASAAQIDTQWRGLVKEHFAAAVPLVGKTDPEIELGIELDRLSKVAAPPARTDVARPILQELENLSLVVGNSGFSLESLDIDISRVQIYVIGDSIQDAADMLEAFQMVGGSSLTDWTYDPRNAPSAPGKIRTTYNAKWPPVKASGTAGPSERPR